MPLAWKREQAHSIAGLRTFPLVTIASCGFVGIAFELYPTPDAQSRVIQGLMTGIGFIGGGAIVKKGFGVRGTGAIDGIRRLGAQLDGLAIHTNKNSQPTHHRAPYAWLAALSCLATWRPFHHNPITRAAKVRPSMGPAIATAC